MEREKEREREEKKGQLKFYNTFQGRSRLKAGANCKTAKQAGEGKGSVHGIEAVLQQSGSAPK